jgi:hypothetical protein
VRNGALELNVNVRAKWSATSKLTQPVPLVFAILRLASIRKLEGFLSAETGSSVANKRFARLLQYHSQNLFLSETSTTRDSTCPRCCALPPPR